MATQNLDTTLEHWASIDGYLNYQVSWWGRVLNTKTGRILKNAFGSHGYLQVGLSKNGKVKTHCIHVMVAQAWALNPEDKKCVDHIDGDKTNNHHENLRFATHSENNRNKSKRANTTSKYYGVCFHKKADKWNAQIQIEGIRKNLGFFTNEKEAAVAFNKAAVDLHKEFARLNIFED